MTSPYSAAMAHAAAAAAAAWGTASPNPTVGAAILDPAGKEIATGVTEPVGGRHAEIVALDAAGDRARGGTLVVTLEPCNHYGRTPPCTERIIAAGVERVVFAVGDPTVTASGGAARLVAAGVDVIQNQYSIDVEQGPLGAWLHRQRTGLPRVTWKYAASLDGRSAAGDGTSKWITGPHARAHTLRRRQRYDAIIVGTGTARADDPSLTARDADGHLLPRQPLRVVMGLSELAAGAAIYGTDGRFRHLRTHDPRAALAQLAASDDVLEVLLEGGPRLAGAFLAAEVVDRIEAYIAPLALGAGAATLGPAGVDTLAAAPRFAVLAHTTVGDDVFIELRRAARTSPTARFAGMRERAGR